jgi:SAM-dependent methyltransferase
VAKIRGTEGYGETAQDYLARDRDLVFDEVHAPILHLLPRAPSDILDIGAGSGRDAAHLAALGHRLVAVEPTDELRAHAVSTYASPRIEWLNDGLPNLGATRALNRSYDFVMLSAVWMHLDEAERARAMPNLASLMRKDARAAISLRHGPVPPGRRMFEVTAEETMALAQASGLACLLNQRHPSIQEHNRRAGVVWTRLAFRRE